MYGMVERRQLLYLCHRALWYLSAHPVAKLIWSVSARW